MAAAAAASAAATIDQPGEADTQGQDPTIDGVNGVSEEPIQQQVQLQPQFFDMDLERIHIELYRSKYLTPQDFLDDIRKIVHNAEMMADLDTDRLFRAQALLTTADLSTQNFDVQFRLECQRMAIRERRRREEYRKSKDKSRAADAEGQAASSSEVYPPGTRRSARNNGQQPELEITDPLQLERRLKRQRSAELVAEVVENSDEDNRSAKRTRTTPEESAINGDPPDPTQEGSPHPHVVRFADDARQTLPLPPLPEDRPSQDIPVQDVPVEGIPTQEVPVPEAPVQEIIMQETPVQQPPVVETRTRPAFEMLLNPEPEIVTPLPLPNGLGHSNEMQPSLLSPPPAEPHATASSVQDVALPEPVQVNGTVDVTQSMEVCEPQKEDTPPPEFIIDETLVSHLFSLLRESTHPLNVEQLEELRATCLNAIWQHRSDWNRTLLIEKLCDLVKDYVEELSDSSMNEGSPRFR